MGKPDGIMLWKSYRLSVPSVLTAGNINVTSKTPPHHHNGNNTFRNRLVQLTKTQQLEPKISNDQDKTTEGGGVTKPMFLMSQRGHCSQQQWNHIIR